MSTALKLLKVENEENALHCIKIIIDGFRSHKVSALLKISNSIVWRETDE